MRIDLNKADTDTAVMAGMGPAAWERDSQKMSMHPPIPGHIEFVEEHMELHHHDHHTVQRKHPQNDCEEGLVKKEIPLPCLLPLLAGKKYISRKTYKQFHSERSASDNEEEIPGTRQSESLTDGPVEPGAGEGPAVVGGSF